LKKDNDDREKETEKNAEGDEGDRPYFLDSDLDP
jgi:hypothetical protein